MGKHGYTARGDEESKLQELSKGWPARLQSHPLHRQHPLLKSLRQDYSCDSCRKPGSGWSFLCVACDFDLHPDCAVEGQLADTGKTWPRTVAHRLHLAHPLVKTRLDSFWCDSCGERGSWWCFYCERCDFGLHPQCAVGSKGLPPVQPPEMEKTVKESYWCSKCAEEGKGHCYSWEDCNVDLHPRCAGKGSGSWPKTAKHELHAEHELVKSQNVGYYCDSCWTEGQGWSFGCGDCDFHLHPKCAVGVPSEETGWIDGVMYEQQKQQLKERREKIVAEESEVNVEEELPEEEDGGGSAEELQMKLLQAAVEQQLRMELTGAGSSAMSELEQIRLYAEVVAMIQGGSAQAVSDLAGGFPPRRRDPPTPPYNWPNQNRPFGYY